MTLKKIKIIGGFGMFALCFLTHFLYDFFPNYLFSIFFPVNESVWEHMKMMTSSILIWSVFEYLLLKKYRINHNNYLVSLFVMCCGSIIIFLAIYLPCYYLIGPTMFLNLLCLFITLSIVSYFSFLILSLNSLKKLNYLALIGIVFLYIIFGILTYHPLENNLFYDKLKHKYGINIYELWFKNVGYLIFIFFGLGKIIGFFFITYIIKNFSRNINIVIVFFIKTYFIFGC